LIRSAEMSFNKSKTRQSAERYLAQGKIKAAINEYVFLVDNDPTDYNTLNILGDLYARVQEKESAIECFKKLAEHYNKQGFSQKAIAVYNKITRLKPDSVEVSAKLAPLYQMKGLVAEARSHYSVLAEYYKNNGKKLEALKIWQQIAELDPNNVEVFFTLAENYLQENYTEEAAEAFTEAGRRFANQKNYEKAISAYSKALEIHPLEISAIEGLISCQITCGYYDEAISLIQRTLDEHPNNIDLMSLLLSCHIELGNYVEAENTVIALVETEPSNYRKFLDVVGLHLKNKDTASATRILSMCSEHLLVAGQAEELKTWVDEILAQNPEQVEALSILVRLHAWQREDEELKGALIQMAEAAHANNDFENEKTALSQLVLMAPQEIRFRERLAELGGDDGEVSYGFADAGAYSTQEVPTFESFENLSDNEEEYTQNVEILSSEDIDSLMSDADTITTGFALVTDDGYRAPSNGSNGNGHSNIHDSIDTYPTVSVSSADIIPESPAYVSALEKSRETHLLQELESVDFYLNEGYEDLAIQTLDLLESQFGSHPEIESRRQQLNAKMGITSPEAAADAAYEATSEIVTETPSHEFQAEEIITPEPQVSFQESAPELAQLASPVSPVSPLSVETPAEPMPEISYDAALDMPKTAPKPAEEETTKPIEFGAMNAVEEVAAELAELPSAPDTFETAVDQSLDDLQIPVQESLQTLLDDESLDDAVNALGAETEHSLFEDFRNDLGLEDSEPVSNSDYETHFNLGTAYKEMGLFEDAVEAFQEAVKLVTPDEEGRRFLSCCHALGHCFMEKSMPKLAQLWYEKAQQSRNLTVDERQALNYEIALAFEKQNKPKQAVELYSEIYAVDVTYRDVKQKLDGLQLGL
jgi:pilus assembly protein FimV